MLIVSNKLTIGLRVHGNRAENTGNLCLTSIATNPSRIESLAGLAICKDSQNLP